MALKQASLDHSLKMPLKAERMRNQNHVRPGFGSHVLKNKMTEEQLLKRDIVRNGLIKDITRRLV